MTRYRYVAVATAVLVLSLYLSGIFSALGNSNLAFAQASTNKEKYGLIGSMQNNPQGHRAWIVTGVWVVKFGNASATNNGNASSLYKHVSDFNASLTMVMLNGTALHNHQISNFTQRGNAAYNSTRNSTTIHGTVTVTMREGPVHGVNVTIIILKGKISIVLDPSKTNNHFGNTPIYGTVGLSEAEAKQFAMLSSNVTMGNKSQMTMMTQGSQNNSGNS